MAQIYTLSPSWTPTHLSQDALTRRTQEAIIEVSPDINDLVQHADFQPVIQDAVAYILRERPEIEPTTLRLACRFYRGQFTLGIEEGPPQLRRWSKLVNPSNSEALANVSTRILEKVQQIFGRPETPAPGSPPPSPPPPSLAGRTTPLVIRRPSPEVAASSELQRAFQTASRRVAHLERALAGAQSAVLEASRAIRIQQSDTAEVAGRWVEAEQGLHKAQAEIAQLTETLAAVRVVARETARRDGVELDAQREIIATLERKLQAAQDLANTYQRSIDQFIASSETNAARIAALTKELSTAQEEVRAAEAAREELAVAGLAAFEAVEANFTTQMEALTRRSEEERAALRALLTSVTGQATQATLRHAQALAAAQARIERAEASEGIAKARIAVLGDELQTLHRVTDSHITGYREELAAAQGRHAAGLRRLYEELEGSTAQRRATERKVLELHETLAWTSTELDAATTAKKEVEAELAELRTVLARSTGEFRSIIGATEQELTDLRSTIGVLEAERAEAATNLAALTAAHQANLDSKEDDLRALQARLEDAQASTAAAGEVIASHRALVATTAGEKDTALAQLKDAEEKLTALQAKEKELARELTQAQEAHRGEIAALQTSFRDQKAALEARLKEVNDSYARELAAIEARGKAIQEQAKAADRNHQSAVATLQEKIAAAEDSQRAAQARIEGLTRQYAESTAKLARVEEEKTDLELQLKAAAGLAAAEKTASEAKLAAQEGRYGRLKAVSEASLSEARRKIAAQEDQLAALHIQLAQEKGVLEESQAAQIAARREVQDLQASSEKLGRDMAALAVEHQGEMARAAAQIRESEEATSAIARQMEDLGRDHAAAIAARSAELEGAQGRAREAQAALHAQGEELTAKETALAALRGELEDLRRESSRAQEETAARESEKERLTHELAGVRAALERAEAELGRVKKALAAAQTRAGESDAALEELAHLRAKAQESARIIAALKETHTEALKDIRRELAQTKADLAGIIEVPVAVLHQVADGANQLLGKAQHRIRELERVAAAERSARAADAVAIAALRKSRDEEAAKAQRVADELRTARSAMRQQDERHQAEVERSQESLSALITADRAQTSQIAALKRTIAELRPTGDESDAAAGLETHYPRYTSPSRHSRPAVPRAEEAVDYTADIIDLTARLGVAEAHTIRLQSRLATQKREFELASFDATRRYEGLAADFNHSLAIAAELERRLEAFKRRGLPPPPEDPTPPAITRVIQVVHDPSERVSCQLNLAFLRGEVTLRRVPGATAHTVVFTVPRYLAMALDYPVPPIDPFDPLVAATVEILVSFPSAAGAVTSSPLYTELSEIASACLSHCGTGESRAVFSTAGAQVHHFKTRLAKLRQDLRTANTDPASQVSALVKSPKIGKDVITRLEIARLHAGEAPADAARTQLEDEIVALREKLKALEIR